MVSDLTGRLQLIGEWADGTLALNEERRMLDMNMLNEIIRRKVNGIDLQLLLVGMVAILGIFREDEDMMYALEICVPLSAGDGEECDLDMLERKTSALKELRNMGFYLVGEKGGLVKCYKEGRLDSLEADLSSIESALAR